VPVVGIAPTPDGQGDWLVAAEGGIFSFGAGFSGSTGSLHLAAPVTGMEATPDGAGYWLVAGDGGVLTLGDGMRDRAPCVSQEPANSWFSPKRE
jgi:hypothetical protein